MKWNNCDGYRYENILMKDNMSDSNILDYSLVKLTPGWTSEKSFKPQDDFIFHFRFEEHKPRENKKQLQQYNVAKLERDFNEQNQFQKHS